MGLGRPKCLSHAALALEAGVAVLLGFITLVLTTLQSLVKLILLGADIGVFGEIQMLLLLLQPPDLLLK